MKKKITQWGNAAMTKIPYEEWSLKAVPRIKFEPTHISADDQEALIENRQKIEVLYPASVIEKEEVQTIIMDLVNRRRPIDWRLLWWSLLGAPLTLPLVLLPVVPNIPGEFDLFTFLPDTLF